MFGFYPEHRFFALRQAQSQRIFRQVQGVRRGLAALNSKTGSDGFLFYVMKYFKQIFDRRNSEGTTFGSITKNDLYSLTLAFPTIDTLKKYDEVVTNYNKMIFERSLENQELAELRDWLLPMLMNGQVSVGV